jgi:hypothetical protein
LLDFHEICYGCNAIQGDLDAIFFNAIASIVLQLLTFTVLGETYSAVGLHCLCSVVTMAAKLFTLGNQGMITKFFTLGQKRRKGVAGFKLH